MTPQRKASSAFGCWAARRKRRMVGASSCSSWACCGPEMGLTFGQETEAAHCARATRSARRIRRLNGCTGVAEGFARPEPNRASRSPRSFRVIPQANRPTVLGEAITNGLRRRVALAPSGDSGVSSRGRRVRSLESDSSAGECLKRPCNAPSIQVAVGVPASEDDVADTSSHEGGY